MENGRIDYKVVLDTCAMQAEANKVTQSFSRMASQAQSEGSKMESAFSAVAGNIGKAFAALGAAATFQQLSQKILQVRGEFQQLEVAFETMLGSARQADSLMSQLVSTAATTPFGLQEVANGAKQLLAYGTSAEEVNDTLIRLGDIAAGLSIPLNDLVYLYGTTMTQGRLYAQDLRQFMGRGIPIVEELAKQFNVTKEKVSELVSEGKVGFPEVKKAIQSLTDEGSKFGGLMEKQSHTITGQISNIEDALDMMFNDLGQQSEGIINGILSSISFVIEHYETFGKILLGVVAAYGEYKAALMVTSAYQSLLANQEAQAAAVKEAALAKAIANATGEVVATDASTAATEANTAAKEGNVAAIDQQVAATMRALQSKVFEMQVNEQAAAAELQTAQSRAAAAEQNFAVKQQEYMAAVRNGNMSQITATRAALETAAKEKQATAYQLSTAQKNVEAAATQRNAAQQKLATFQTEVDTAMKGANTTATGLWAAVTNTATAAWKGLTTAMATNPLGMALMGITAVITAMSLFSSSTDEATGAVERFREATTEDTVMLMTYNRILSTMDPNTQAYKDALKGVKDLAAQHGVAVAEENGKLKDQDKTIKNLSTTIKKHAAEKVLSESASEANEKALKKEEAAMKDLMDEAKNAEKIISQNVDAFGNVTMTTEALADVQKVTGAQWSLISQQVMANSQNLAEAFKQSQEAGRAAVEEQVDQIGEMLSIMGVSDESIKEFHNALYKYVRESAEGFQEVYGELEQTEVGVNSLTDSVVNNASETNALALQYGSLRAVAGDTLDVLIIKQFQIENEISRINSHPLSPQADTSRLEYLRSLLYEIQGLIGDVAKGSLNDLRAQMNALKTKIDGLPPDSQERSALVKQYNATKKAYDQLNHSTYGGGGGGGGRGGGHHGGGGGHGSRHHGGGSSYKPKPEDPRDVEYTIDQLREKYNEKLQELIEDISDDVSHGVTEAMEKGNEKVIAQIKQDTQDDLDALDEQIKKLEEARRERDERIWKKQNPNKPEREYNPPAELSVQAFLALPENKQLADEYTNRRAQILEEGRKAEEDVRKKAAEDEKDAWNQYLIEYGNYTQKKAAIDAKYAKEINEATTAGEKMRLQRQWQDAIAELDMEALKRDINWEQVFNELDRLSVETLKRLKERLKEALNDKDITAENAKVISEQIEKINDEIIQRQTTWRSSFGLVIPELEEQKRLEREAAEAKERVNDALKKQIEAQHKVILQQREIQTLLEDNNTGYEGNISTENMEQILSMFKGDNASMNKLVGLFGQLGQAEGKLTQETENYEAAAKRAKGAAEAAGGSMATTVAIIDKIIHTINDNIQSSVEIVEQLGLSETKFGKGWSSFAESSQYASDAWEALKSGNIMGVANGVVGSLRTLGDALGEWGIGMFGSSDKNLLKDLEKLTISNEALELAMSRLTKVMEEQAGSDLAKTYEQAVSDLKESMANTQEMLARSAAAYNKGFFGIGGKSSANYKISKLLSTADWQRISQLMGKSITDVAQLWDLSSEELGKLAETAPDIWAILRKGASEGYQDISEYLETYIEYYDKLKELQLEYNQSITQTNMDEIKSGLSELIKDSETNAYDVIGNVSEMMQNAILNIVMTKTMKSKLDKWYEDFATAMADDTLSAMENAALEQGYADIYKQAKEEVDRAYKLAGIDPNRNDVEDASTGAWSALGEETGRSIDGRLTAIHIQTTKIGELLALNSEAMNRMELRGLQDSGALTEMQNLVFISTSHLERIARNSDSLPSINSKLEQIRQNTDRL